MWCVFSKRGSISGPCKSRFKFLYVMTRAVWHHFIFSLILPQIERSVVQTIDTHQPFNIQNSSFIQWISIKRFIFMLVNVSQMLLVRFFSNLGNTKFWCGVFIHCKPKETSWIALLAHKGREQNIAARYLDKYSCSRPST